MLKWQQLSIWPDHSPQSQLWASPALMMNWGWQAAVQPCPHARICFHHCHPEGSKIKGSSLILLQSFLSVSIRVSSVSAYSTCLQKIYQFRSFCWLSTWEKWETGSWWRDRLGEKPVAGGQAEGGYRTIHFPVQRGDLIPIPRIILVLLT